MRKYLPYLIFVALVLAISCEKIIPTYRTALYPASLVDSIRVSRNNHSFYIDGFSTASEDEFVRLRQYVHEWVTSHRNLERKASKAQMNLTYYAKINKFEITCNCSLMGETPGVDISDYYFILYYLSPSLKRVHADKSVGLNSLDPRPMLAASTCIKPRLDFVVPEEARFDIKIIIEDLDTGEERLLTM